MHGRAGGSDDGQEILDLAGEIVVLVPHLLASGLLAHSGRLPLDNRPET